CTLEPRIQYILILLPVLFIRRRLHSHMDLPRLLMVPGRNLMAPPPLSRDAPVADFFHPPAERGIKTLGYEVDRISGILVVETLFGQTVHAYEPLCGQVRFNDCGTSLGVSDGMDMRLYFNHQFLVLMVFDQRLPAFDPIHYVILSSMIIHGSVRIHYIDAIEIVAITVVDLVYNMCSWHFRHCHNEFHWQKCI